MSTTFLASYESPLGPMILSSRGQGLTGLWFENQKFFGSTLTSETLNCEVLLPEFEAAISWLDAYFSKARPDFVPPLDLIGSEFRQLIWQLLLEIPYGQTITYGQLAAKAADLRGQSRLSAQAVGGAVGHNPISLIVPCHRVIGAGGSLTGYAGGLDRKQYLLNLEGSLKL